MNETLSKQTTQFSNYEKLVQCLVESIRKCSSSTSHTGIKDELSKLFSSPNGSNSISSSIQKLNIVDLFAATVDSNKKTSSSPSNETKKFGKLPQQKK